MDPSICKELKSNIYPLKFALFAPDHFHGAKSGSEIGTKSSIVVKSVEEINKLSEEDTDRIIQMAWEDRTPFEAIEFQFGIKEKEVIEFMRMHSKRSSFQMWRKRMSGRITKHVQKRVSTDPRFKCSMQRSISLNKISKR
ncbi:TIGR03643 family protein [Aquirufa nivalisilvae]|nr:TIGR03643 family protein [Aquirufa nivalisilvae]